MLNLSHWLLLDRGDPDRHLAGAVRAGAHVRRP